MSSRVSRTLNYHHKQSKTQILFLQLLDPCSVPTGFAINLFMIVSCIILWNRLENTISTLMLNLFMLEEVNIPIGWSGKCLSSYCENGPGKESLIIGHVCFGRDWKECCFIYGSQTKRKRASLGRFIYFSIGKVFLFIHVLHQGM